MRRLAAAGAAALTTAMAAAAVARPAPVALVSTAPSALAAELARELAASGFAVLVAPAGDEPWQQAVSAPALAEVREGVVVDPAAQQVWTFQRAPDGAPRVVATFLVDDRDALARRRTWLAVVEQLRLPAEAAAPRPPATPEPAPPAEEARAPAPRPRSFALGAATALALAGAAGEPTGHVQLVWLVPFRPRLAFQARALWPLVGAQVQTAEHSVRMWTFGGAAGLHGLLAGPGGRWRPFVGVAAGTRLVLADRNDLAGPSSRTRFTPAVALGAQLGVRYELRPHLDLFLEAEAGYGWPVASVGRSPLEQATAGGRSGQVALGVLFGY